MNNKTWADMGLKWTSKLHHQKLNCHDVQEIKKLIAIGMRVKDIAEKYKSSVSNISKIKNGIYWSEV